MAARAGAAGVPGVVELLPVTGPEGGVSAAVEAERGNVGVGLTGGVGLNFPAPFRRLRRRK